MLVIGYKLQKKNIDVWFSKIMNIGDTKSSKILEFKKLLGLGR
jgi:hypothetical protein